MSNSLHQLNAKYLMYINIKYVSPTCFGTNVSTSDFREHKMPGLEPIISCYLQGSTVGSSSVANVSYV